MVDDPQPFPLLDVHGLEGGSSSPAEVAFVTDLAFSVTALIALLIVLKQDSSSSSSSNQYTFTAMLASECTRLRSSEPAIIASSIQHMYDSQRLNVFSPPKCASGMLARFDRMNHSFAIEKTAPSGLPRAFGSFSCPLAFVSWGRGRAKIDAWRVANGELINKFEFRKKKIYP